MTKKGIVWAVGICLFSGVIANAKPVRHAPSIQLVPPPPAIAPTTITSKDLSFKDNCALIALNHVLDTNSDILTEESRKAVTQAAWELADKMEAERTRRCKIQ